MIGWDLAANDHAPAEFRALLAAAQVTLTSWRLA